MLRDGGTPGGITRLVIAPNRHVAEAWCEREGVSPRDPDVLIATLPLALRGLDLRGVLIDVLGAPQLGVGQRSIEGEDLRRWLCMAGAQTATWHLDVGE